MPLQSILVLLLLCIYFFANDACFCLQASSSTTALSMSSVDGMIGVSTEAGGAVFDPLGLAELHSINPLVNPHPKVSTYTAIYYRYYPRRIDHPRFPDRARVQQYVA